MYEIILGRRIKQFDVDEPYDSPEDSAEGWEVIYQKEQPMISDGYSAIKIVPGRDDVWMVKKDYKALFQQIKKQYEDLLANQDKLIARERDAIATYVERVPQIVDQRQETCAKIRNGDYIKHEQMEDLREKWPRYE